MRVIQLTLIAVICCNTKVTLSDGSEPVQYSRTFVLANRGEYKTDQPHRVIASSAAGSPLRCAARCLRNARCWQFCYGKITGQCVLEDASLEPASLEPDFLLLEPASGGPAEADSCSYYTIQVLPRVTDVSYNTRAQASAECQNAGQHLCELWEVEELYAANHEGLLPVLTDLWYAVPDSQAVISGSEVIQHGLPMTTPSLGVCCQGSQLSPLDPIITDERFDVDDLAAQKRGCAQHFSHVCTLPELKAAYLRGYRESSVIWCYIATPQRDATLALDACGKYTGEECYEGVVPNTPRPGPNQNMYCCPNIY